MASYDVHWQSRAKKRRAQRGLFRRYLYILGGGLLVMGLTWVVFRSPMLHVQAVAVEGVDRLTEDRVIAVAQANTLSSFQKIIGSDHIWSWSKSLSGDTKKLLPNAKAIDIKRSYVKRKIVIEVQERQPVGIWCFEKTGEPYCQWFDEEGLAYQQAFVSKGNLVPIVHDAGQDELPNDRRVLPDYLLKHFLTVLQILRERNLAVGDIQIPNLSKEEVTVVTNGGPKLLFTLRDAPDHAAPVLDDFIQKGELQALEYIDFRSAKRAFYR